jgi:CDP-diglyceride synthetase
MISADVDPRYRKAIVAHGLYDRKSFADVIRLAVLTLGAILIPAGYVYRMIRERQWSLQTLLLAPAVSMLALVCWRALQSSQSGYLIPDTIAGVMAATSVWAVFTLLRHQSWKILGASIALSMLLATLLMFGAQATMPLRSPGVIGYWTLDAWITSVCAAAAQIVLPMAVGVAWSHAGVKKAGSAP